MKNLSVILTIAGAILSTVATLLNRKDQERILLEKRDKAEEKEES